MLNSGAINLKSNLRNRKGMSIARRNLDPLLVFYVDHAESEVPIISVRYESGRLGTNSLHDRAFRFSQLLQSLHGPVGRAYTH